MTKFQDLSSYRNPKGIRGRGVFIVQLWRSLSGTVWRCSPKFAHGFRVMLLRAFGAKIGTNVRISPSTKVTYPWLLSIGDNCWVGDDTVIYNLAEIRLGNDVALAHKVYLCTGSHDIHKSTFDIQIAPIILEDQVWLANDVFVRGGVRIGVGTVVSARSTVLSDLEPAGVFAGAPARYIRSRIET